MKHGAALVAIVMLAVVATADARPVDEERHRKVKKRTSAFTREDHGSPTKLKRSDARRRRMERSLEEDFRTGIGDNKGKGRRMNALGGDDEDE